MSDRDLLFRKIEASSKQARAWNSAFSIIDNETGICPRNDDGGDGNKTFFVKGAVVLLPSKCRDIVH